MIDPTKEPLIPIGRVPKLSWLRRLHRRATGENPRDIHLSTVYRWCTRGIRGVRLEYVQVGGVRATSEAAVVRFFETLTAQGRAEQGLQKDKVTKDLSAVERQLDAAGI